MKMKNKKFVCYDATGKKYLFGASKLKFRLSVYDILILQVGLIVIL